MTRLPHRDQKPTSSLWGYKEWEHSNEPEPSPAKGGHGINNEENQRRELKRDKAKESDGSDELGRSFDADARENSEGEPLDRD